MNQVNTQTKHQAFARTYRPQIFSEVVGQEHVLQALSYSLDQQNLHHAYLLTGTRGVGKTTLGRLFAKALNCEKGISSSPCGTCSACESIAAGRFVDLIEVDGASNTKVEDTRELLEDVQFVPTQGRFKIYLIDEVHMLSTHSFNALLKTLEEPPEHVKFILATTDPQKLPITVVSRCLQFHLQLLPVPLIQKHIAEILNKESIAFEDRALYLLAEAAQGSMRDALTLTDQARSQGQGQVLTDQVTKMLGILDQKLACQLLNAVLKDEPHSIFTTFQNIEATGADADQILKDLIELCHQVALTQSLGADHIHQIFNDPSLCSHLIELASISSGAQIQLCFETLLGARKTLAYSSSPATAVRMALLRMACFRAFNSETLTSEATEKKNVEISQTSTFAAPVPAPVPALEPAPRVEINNSAAPVQPSAEIRIESEPKPQEPQPVPTSQLASPAPEVQNVSEPVHQIEEQDNSLSKNVPESLSSTFQNFSDLTTAQGWFQFLQKANPGGMFGQLLFNSRLTEVLQNSDQWHAHLVVSDSIFGYDAVDTAKAVARFLKESLKTDFVVQCSQSTAIEQSPAELRIAAIAKAKEEWHSRLNKTPFITKLKEFMPVSVQTE